MNSAQEWINIYGRLHQPPDEYDESEDSDYVPELEPVDPHAKEDERYEYTQEGESEEEEEEEKEKKPEEAQLPAASQSGLDGESQEGNESEAEICEDSQTPPSVEK
jgi:hypothetical protein